MYKLDFSKKFLKQLADFPPKEQQKILNKLPDLTTDPRAVNLKLLTTKPSIYRFRIGEYRLFFEIDEPIKTIRITDVLRRTTQTYH